jgi:uncharacterized protein YqfA (UPF0365 family)
VQERKENTMVALKLLFMIVGVILFSSASALVGYDVYMAMRLRRLLLRS